MQEKIVPNDVAILGDVKGDGRRNYAKFWADLVRAIQGELSRYSYRFAAHVSTTVAENPSEWGYTISPDTGHFAPSLKLPDIQPFKVHLFGRLFEGVHIPPELEEHVLVFHPDLDYVDYYRELSKIASSPVVASDQVTDSMLHRTLSYPFSVTRNTPETEPPLLSQPVSSLVYRRSLHRVF
jgi:hypothetical protein